MPETLKDKLQQDFCSYYHWINDIQYSWSAKDNSHLGQLISKIKGQLPGSKLSSDNMRQEVRDYFKYCFHSAPQWYRDNCEIPIINTKFNILWKLYRKPVNDPSEYDKLNQAVNYKDGNKKKNPQHTSEPAGIGQFINQFIAGNTDK